MEQKLKEQTFNKNYIPFCAKERVRHKADTIIIENNGLNLSICVAGKQSTELNFAKTHNLERQQIWDRVNVHCI